MPLYEYECPACRKVHEVMQKFSDAPLAECPDCGGPVAKIMSRTSFALKGSGWYTTDYKRKSSGDGAPKTDSKESAPAATVATAESKTTTPAAAPAAAAPASSGTKTGTGSGSGSGS